MDPRISDLAESAKTKYGLTAYRFHRWQMFRAATVFRETVYLLSMEWFPNHIDHGDRDDDTNPDGTACIEIDIHSGKLRSLIFVGGISHADGIKFDIRHRDGIIRWIEQETGLVYGKQFMFWKETGRKLYFKGCVDGIAVAPAAEMELHLDGQGKIVFFSMTGTFPPSRLVKKEAYVLSPEQAEKWAEQQLKWAIVPDWDRKRFMAVYGIEEIYIRNDNTATRPCPDHADELARVPLDTVITWDSPQPAPFHRKNISLVERVTPEQAFRREPHPDLAPITEEDVRRCVRSVQTFLRQVRADESGKWTLTSLHREKGYLIATIQAKDGNERPFRRKMKLLIDPPTGEVLNYTDNEPLLAAYADFKEAEECRITAEEAWEKLKRWLTLTPYYVYDRQLDRYVLCGKLDCNHAVKADTGEVIPIPAGS